MIIKINKSEFEINRVINISPNGSDSLGDGSRSNPFKTLGKALGTAVSGDAIFFMAGVHSLTDSEVYGVSPTENDGLFTDNGKSLIIYSNITNTKIICTFTKANPKSYEYRYYSITIRGVSNIINLNLEINSPSTGSSYANSIFHRSNKDAKILNNIIRIINPNGSPSLFYDNGYQQINIKNNIIYIKSKGYSGNYSGNPLFVDNYINTNYWNRAGLEVLDTSSGDIFTYSKLSKGLFGGLYPPNIKVYLVKQNNQYYSMHDDYYDDSNQTYLPLESMDFNYGFWLSDLFKEITINEETFKPIDKFDNFTLISENASDINYNYQAIKTNSELIVANGDIVTNIAENIDYINVIANKIRNGSIRLAFSIDKGITWKSYNGAEFIDLSCSIPLKNYTDLTKEELVLWNIAKEEIYSNGTTTELFNSIDFNLLESSTIRFAYVISRPTYADTAETSQLEWKFDAKGHFEKMKDAEYKLELYEKQIKIISSINNPIIKANIII